MGDARGHRKEPRRRVDLSTALSVSWCCKQLGRIQHKIAGKAPGIPVPVVTDDDDALYAADDGWANPFSLLKAAQAGYRDTARRRTWLAAPAPEVKGAWLA